MLKLKIGAGTKGGQNNSGGDGQKTPQTPAASTPTTGGGFKLKLNVSQPPTPIDQGPSTGAPASGAPVERKKRAYTKKNADSIPKGKKRALEDDGAGPAAKRKISLKLGGAAPSAGAGLPKLSLGGPKKPRTVPKLLDIRARGKVPPRPKGVGYDSEDSETEKDPAHQQALILRMEPGPDADYLRSAIAELSDRNQDPTKGDAFLKDVSLKFIERNLRRAVIKIQGRMYAAALVDLPCIIESMKSFDKKGWWKVADIAQMLLVLGRCENDEQARKMPLPRDVNKETYAYAHGITPPMQWVRKRRFRKRLNYNEALNVEEEVNRLLQADKEWEERGGVVTSARAGELQQQQEQQAQQGEGEEAQNAEYSFDLGDEDALGDDAVETVEHDGDEDMEEGDPDLEAGLQAMFDENEDEGDVSQLVSESPAPIADQAASMAAVESAMQSDMEATPVGTPAADQTQDEQSDDEEEESDEDDEDSPDVVDEDAAAKAAERAQQLEEVADLEREVERARQKVASMTNQLLAQREKKKLAALEEELAVKKQVFDIDNED
ncbi:putative TAFII55 protein region [Septoria linicola]|nr:putative TAFII55 protein region [Septoria linicola]